jgi:hypothetical protein
MIFRKNLCLYLTLQNSIWSEVRDNLYKITCCFRYNGVILNYNNNKAEWDSAVPMTTQSQNTPLSTME